VNGLANMSDRLKKLVQEINKYAQVPTRSKGSKTTVAPSKSEPISNVPHKTTNIPSVKPIGGGANPSEDVKKMQQAILNLADVASATDVTSMSGNQSGKLTGNQTRAIPVVDDKNIKPGDLTKDQAADLNAQTKDDKNYLGGSDAFGNFITQNYLKNSPFIGKQYLNTDVSGQENRQSASIKPTNLRGIIDTIKRVGSPNAKGEKSVDGLWQTRTNNALHVIRDLVSAMLSFTKDMNIKVPGYTEDDLKKFRVPESYNDMKSSEEISSIAKGLTLHLNAMIKFFENLNAQIFNNKDFRKYIDQKEPFAKYTRNIQIPNNMKVFGIPGIQFSWIKDPKQNWISLNELSSLDNFKGFLRRTLNLTNPDQESINKVFDLVYKQINTQSDPGY
jgi:hypothetical protein